jgi:hypothetical protein
MYSGKKLYFLYNEKTGKIQGFYETKAEAEKKLSSYARGGFVTDIKEVIASEDLLDELDKKKKKNDPIVAFSYTDYERNFGDKVAIEYFKKYHPKNIVFEESAYNGQNAIVFGKPAKEFLEATKDYTLGYEDMESFYYEMQNEIESRDFNDFLQTISKEYKVSKNALSWLEENRGGYYVIDTTGLDFSYDDLTETLLDEKLIKRK